MLWVEAKNTGLSSTDPWLLKLALGTWIVTFLDEKEPGLVSEV